MCVSCVRGSERLSIRCRGGVGPGSQERAMLQTGFMTGSDLLRLLRVGESFQVICTAEA